MTFTGSCNRNLFEMWLEECLLPKLQSGDVIVIDNASFHRSQVIDELVAEAGCELWYLPSYSPDRLAIIALSCIVAAFGFPAWQYVIPGMCIGCGLTIVLRIFRSIRDITNTQTA